MNLWKEEASWLYRSIIEYYYVTGRTKHRQFGRCEGKDVVLYLHFLRDVTSALSTLSLAMQRREATVADIYAILTTTQKVLQKFKTRYIIICVSDNIE